MSESITNHDKPAGFSVYGAPVADTGYTNICPICLKRSGGPRFGVRDILLNKCEHHKGEVIKRAKTTRNPIKDPRPIF